MKQGIPSVIKNNGIDSVRPSVKRCIWKCNGRDLKLGFYVNLLEGVWVINVCGLSLNCFISCEPYLEQPCDHQLILNIIVLILPRGFTCLSYS